MRRLSSIPGPLVAAFVLACAIMAGLWLSSGTASAAPASQPTPPTAATETITGTTTLAGTWSKTGAITLTGNVTHTGTLTQPVKFAVTGEMTPTGTFTVTTAAGVTDQFTLTGSITPVLGIKLPRFLDLTGSIEPTGAITLTGKAMPPPPTTPLSLTLSGDFTLVLPAPAAAITTTTAPTSTVPLSPTVTSFPQVWEGSAGAVGRTLYVVFPGITEAEKGEVPNPLVVYVTDEDGRTIPLRLKLTEVSKNPDAPGTYVAKLNGDLRARRDGLHKLLPVTVLGHPISGFEWTITKDDLVNMPALPDTGTSDHPNLWPLLAFAAILFLLYTQRHRWRRA